MIRLEGVSKSFRALDVLASIDLEVRPGEWLGVFGRNGSGKTSLLRILVGLSAPTAGRVLIDGRESDAASWRAFHNRLGYMPERIAFHEHLTGRKTLEFYARLKGAGDTDLAGLLERLDLLQAADRKVGTYSKGMRQRLSFAQALVGDPEMLILDEPLDGLDPHGARLFFDLIREVENRTVVFTSHQLSRFSSAVDRICVLNGGRLEALGRAEELRSRLGLPLRVVLRASPSSNGALEQALQGHGQCTVERLGGSLVARVAQADKLSFLASLRELGEIIEDVQIEEPSLEEIVLESTN